MKRPSKKPILTKRQLKILLTVFRQAEEMVDCSGTDGFEHVFPELDREGASEGDRLPPASDDAVEDACEEIVAAIHRARKLCREAAR